MTLPLESLEINSYKIFVYQRYSKNGWNSIKKYSPNEPV